MKRIQLFEWEDQTWFPKLFRDRMTLMLSCLHRWLGTKEHVARLLQKMVADSRRYKIVDYCSGDAGLMLDVFEILSSRHELPEMNITLTDLYPNEVAQARIASKQDARVQYCDQSVDAAQVFPVVEGCIRTMICCFHHMNPELAKTILRQAKDAGDPILVYEISDNRFPPKYLWWMGLPLNFLFGVFVAASVRPLTWKHCFFSFFVPVIPICFAWDGAASNARTYTMADLDQLLDGLSSESYIWTKGILPAQPIPHLFLMGTPVSTA